MTTVSTKLPLDKRLSYCEVASPDYSEQSDTSYEVLYSDYIEAFEDKLMGHEKLAPHLWVFGVKVTDGYMVAFFNASMPSAVQVAHHEHLFLAAADYQQRVQDWNDSQPDQASTIVRRRSEQELRADYARKWESYRSQNESEIHTYACPQPHLYLLVSEVGGKYLSRLFNASTEGIERTSEFDSYRQAVEHWHDAVSNLM